MDSTEHPNVMAGIARRASQFMIALLASLFVATAAPAYTVYVSNEKDGTVSIIDSTKLEVVRTVKVGQRPRGITLTKDHRWLLVCASDDNTVQVFDARTMELVKSLPSGQDPELFVLHPAGSCSTSPTRRTISSPWWTSRRIRWWRRFQSVWSLKAWASARTARSW